MGHNTYAGKRSNLHSKPTPIHGPVSHYGLRLSYSRRLFSPLPQAVSKVLIDIFSQKVSYASMMIDPVIIGFSTNKVKIHLHIRDHSIINFGIRGLCLEFSNTSHVDSLDRFRKSC